ncbi:flagellar protein FlaG [Cohnella caldifontis]|uniref:flagellar protein FlaG n=1 Tax=Cohnella caldifontis TaxID=3027471 RepID=UPI0023EB03A3|nr:flagellar protein FlaG [Cohnella sp. YIM B05605]
MNVGGAQRTEIASYGMNNRMQTMRSESRAEGEWAAEVAPVAGPKEANFGELTPEDKKKLDEQLKKINDSLVSYGKMLKFKYNDEAKTTYVEVVDTETQKVVASLPPEFLIDLSVRMKELIGMFIDKKL